MLLSDFITSKGPAYLFALTSLLARIIYSGKKFVEAHPFDTLVSLSEASWRWYLKEEVKLSLEAISILAIVQFFELVFSYLF